MYEVSFYLTQIRILAKFKNEHEDGNPYIDYNRLTYEFGFSKDSARRLVHRYQINVSKATCDFIVRLLKTIPEPPISHEALKMLKNYDDDGRHVLPCYWSMKIIYAHILHTKKIILLEVKRKRDNRLIDKIILPFCASTNYGGALYLPNLTFTSNELCLVLHGVTQYLQPFIETKKDFISRLLEVGLEKIIFFNMAIHPQYPGKKLSEISIAPIKKNDSQSTVLVQLHKEYLTMRNQADKFGCAIMNASLFYIEHIYCDILKRKINLPIKKLEVV